MKDHNRIQQDLLNKVSRRYLLKNSAIAATGAVLLPSFITSCNKHIDFPGKGGGGVGDSPFTPAQLQAAAENLTRLRVWVADLYPLTIEYENVVFHALASTKQNGSWTNFIVDVFIDIATILIASAAAATGPAGFAGAVPAIAGLSSFLHDWGIGKDKPDNLDDVFTDFEFGHNVMQFSMEQKLSHLVDPANNYANLQNEWNEDFVFNGKTYTIGDLASSYFPDLGDYYNTLQTAAFTTFKTLLWNLVIMKCCTYKLADRWDVYMYVNHGTNPGNIQDYARQVSYPINKGLYIRGIVNWIEPNDYRYITLVKWSLGIGGEPFPDEACNILFQDDTPGHIINPDGLFARDYVFKQFAVSKPTFFYTDVKYLDIGGADLPGADFQTFSDWTFTGGMFPKLTH